MADDVALTRSVSAALAARVAAAGIGWTLAPVADVNSDAGQPGDRRPLVRGRRPRWSPGTWPRRCAGIQSAGVAACAKHFPGHGDTAVDSHLGLRDGRRGPCRAGRGWSRSGPRSRPGCATVMTGHLLVPGYGDLPATLNPALVDGLLRAELGFDGVVVSDALEMGAIAGSVGVGEGAVLAVLAGVDALCLGGDEAGEPIADAARDALVAAVRSGRLAEERLAAAAARVRALAGRFPVDRLDVLGLAAARRGMRWGGDVRLGSGAPVLVRLDPAPTIAVGRTAWGLDGLLPGATELVVGPDDPAARGAGRPGAGRRRPGRDPGRLGRARGRRAARRPARRGRGRDGPARAGPAGARLDRHRRRIGRERPRRRRTPPRNDAVSDRQPAAQSRRHAGARLTPRGAGVRVPRGAGRAASGRGGRRVVGAGGPAMIAVGVDAGGTGSRAVVVRDGVVVARRDLGPINVLLHADAVDRLAGAVTEAGAAAAGFGLAGLRSDEHARELTAELARRTGARVVVGDDTDAALAGAFAGRPGVVVIAGTGSGAAGRDAAGRTVRVGGHGFLLGDEGGGYWIGREAVRAALRAADGTGPPTALTELVRRRVRLADRRRDAGAPAAHPTGSCCPGWCRWSPPRPPAQPPPRRPTAPSRAGPPEAPGATRSRRAAAGTPADAAERPEPESQAADDLARTPGRMRWRGGSSTEVGGVLGRAGRGASVPGRRHRLPVAGVGRDLSGCAPVRDAFRAATGAAGRAEPAPGRLGRDGLGRDGLGRDGLGRDGQAGTGWAGTVSNCGPSVRVRLSS